MLAGYIMYVDQNEQMKSIIHCLLLTMQLLLFHYFISFCNLKEGVASHYSIIKGFLRVVLAQTVFVSDAQLTFCGEP